MKRSAGSAAAPRISASRPAPTRRLELHLPQAVLGMNEPEREGGVGKLAASMWGIPQRSRTMVTGASSPATAISPSTRGSDWRSHR